jgi:hypothetical protein
MLISSVAWRVAWYGFYFVENLIVHVVLLDYEMLS